MAGRRLLSSTHCSDTEHACLTPTWHCEGVLAWTCVQIRPDATRGVRLPSSVPGIRRGVFWQSCTTVPDDARVRGTRVRGRSRNGLRAGAARRGDAGPRRPEEGTQVRLRLF